MSITRQAPSSRQVDHERPLTIGEAAAFLNVEVRWMRRAVAERRLPYYKFGHHLRFMPEDLRGYLNATRVDPPARSPGRVGRGRRLAPPGK